MSVEKKLFYSDSEIEKILKKNPSNVGKKKFQVASFEDYKRIRNCEMSDKIELQYAKYGKYFTDNPKSFLENTLNNLDGTLWHLAILKYVESNGGTLKIPKAGDPDIVFEKDRIRYKIECISIQEGNLYGALDVNSMGQVQINNALIRICQGIDSKLKKYRKGHYSKATGEKNILALNSSRMGVSRFLLRDDFKPNFKSLVQGDVCFKKENNSEMKLSLTDLGLDGYIDHFWFSAMECTSFLIGENLGWVVIDFPLGGEAESIFATQINSL